MPLSEHEQRMLEEIETALYAEDPKFASSVRRTAGGGLGRPSILVIVLEVLGLALLFGGLFLPNVGSMPVFSFVGFLVMFAGGVLALRGVGSRPAARNGGGAAGAPRGGERPARGRKAGATGGAARRGGSYTERMEDRFRKRFER